MQSTQRKPLPPVEELKRLHLRTIDASQLRAIIKHYSGDKEKTDELEQVYKDYLLEHDKHPLLIRVKDQDDFSRLINDKTAPIPAAILLDRGPYPLPATMASKTHPPAQVKKKVDNSNDPIPIPMRNPRLPSEFLVGGPNLFNMVRDGVLEGPMAQHPVTTVFQYDWVTKWYRQTEKEAMKAHKHPENHYGTMKLLHVQQFEAAEYAVMLKEHQPSSRTRVGQSIILLPEDNASNTSEHTISDGFVNFCIKKIADYMTRHGKTVLVIPSWVTNQELTAMCSRWSSSLLLRTSAVFFVRYFPAGENRPSAWILAIVEPTEGLLRIYNGHQEHEDHAQAMAREIGAHFRSRVGITLEVYHQPDLPPMDSKSDGPILIILAALFAGGHELRQERKQLTTDQIQELRWWITFQVYQSDDFDDAVMSRMFGRLGQDLSYPDPTDTETIDPMEVDGAEEDDLYD
ncbi:unnamed protein product [Zymoseptoria tritici ST99CH_3D1]|uniref:Uncharacterized protein n=1 Tax=Zymoseptoria tritici (strain ST99CH_3D7) TaxID=1276538 RepID=A0A1X7RV59_ZYMT9|nr:unnamed protein product [Zymoseptoria tritici ST99CH_3D7]SMR54920.1 unnamed protein product [Zymoseptoria tritici ST99CH_3D1]